MISNDPVPNDPKNLKVIAPSVQNACYRYSFLTVKERDLKLIHCTNIFRLLRGSFSLFIPKGTDVSFT